MKCAMVQLPRLSDAEVSYEGAPIRWLRHPLYACLGLRPALAQHTAAEHAAIKKWSAGRRALVELGVAEGVSALAMREGMSDDGTLYLIDPFHLSRLPALNFSRRAAQKAVASCDRGSVIWIQKFSHQAASDWNAPIDFLMIDGDHSDLGVQTDWEDWSRFVAPGGVVIFHDARVFDDGWTNPSYGPVKFVNRLFRAGQAQGWEIIDEVHSLVVIARRAPVHTDLAE